MDIKFEGDGEYLQTRLGEVIPHVSMTFIIEPTEKLKDLLSFLEYIKDKEKKIDGKF